MVAINFGQKIVDDRFVLFHLRGTLARRDIGADGRIKPALDRKRVMGVPDVIARPMAPGDDDRKFGKPRIEPRPPAQVIGHLDRFEAEFGAREIYLEGRIGDGARARPNRHELGEFLLCGRIRFRIDRRKALCLGGDQCARYGESGCQQRDCHELFHGPLPGKHYFGKFCVNFCSLGSLPAGRVPFETIRAIAVLP